MWIVIEEHPGNEATELDDADIHHVHYMVSLTLKSQCKYSRNLDRLFIVYVLVFEPPVTSRLKLVPRGQTHQWCLQKEAGAKRGRETGAVKSCSTRPLGSNMICSPGGRRHRCPSNGPFVLPLAP